MDPVDEFARLKAEIHRLEHQASLLRDGFLRPGARLRSNQHEVVIKRQTRRLFVKHRLPDAILHNPNYWKVQETEVVTLRSFASPG